MKIRIKGASLRLRLSRPEVSRLAGGGEITETTPFPSGGLRYTLRQNADCAALDADFIAGEILITLPISLASGWDLDDRVGFEAYVPLPGGDRLFVLIEKDFQCLDNTGEDQSENYPNPKSC